MQLSTTTLGSGPRSIALVHGMSASSLHWSDVARLLVDEHDCTVTLVDLRGHGDSPRADRYAVDDFPDDLVDTLPQGLDFLMGQSLGGRAVMTAAERLQPKRLIALDPGLRATKAFAIVIKYFNWVGNVLPDAAMRHALLGKSWTCDADDALARVKAGRKKWDPEVRKGVLATGPAAVMGGRAAGGALHDRHAREEHRRAAHVGRGAAGRRVGHPSEARRDPRDPRPGPRRPPAAAGRPVRTRAPPPTPR